jgi:hypothetical protein
MRFLLTMFSAVVVALSAGCSETNFGHPTGAGTPGQSGSAGGADQVPVTVRPALEAIRKGNAQAAHEALSGTEAYRRFQDWLGRALIKGRTTRDDAVGLLGTHFHDLDRPERDSLVSIEYFLGTTADFTTLVLDFDRRTRHLTGWSISQGICGYCPHVFAHDGRWRLEGKMLAGCVGVAHEGTDVLPLPRLAWHQDRLRVRVTNLAREIEHIDRVRLGSVPLTRAEELDLGVDGQTYVWSPLREIVPDVAGTDEDGFGVDWDASSSPRVIALEVRNTSEFEGLMRDALLRGRKPERCPDMTVAFSDGSEVAVRPIGTKLLRRVVVAIPPASRAARFRAADGLWLVRRVWLGTGRAADAEITWHAPEVATDHGQERVALLQQADRRRLRLGPMQGIDLVFGAPTAGQSAGREGFILEMTGYYEFLVGPSASKVAP